jgi:sigma-B regulation protein RsbU (phosphoserine phosphatase)
MGHVIRGDHMRALIADDDRVTAAAISASVSAWGFEVTVVHDGNAAWKCLSENPPPSLAIIDWEMPGLDGPELCRRLRADSARAHLYLLLLTARSSPTDVVAGLEAGADDYLVKPVNLSELRARLHVGVRVVSLQERLATKVAELQATLDKVRQLRGLLPICSYCKRIRNDQNYWERVEVYVTEHTDAKFTHGICPTCLEAAKAEFEKQDAVSPRVPK